MGKYLAAHPGYILHFGKQKDFHALHGYGDSDFAGETQTRKSTSGGMICLGNHVVKSWGSTQTVIALSTGEAKLYARRRPPTWA